ncbi:MAG: hypothetical protein P4L85_24860 [Paludisphaera borealis]|uniref:hypothetical protein n=1 Tax=Paludisphaera borealis TaxID=1387353 RepID=UPI00284BE114|nr:hypothetical protein [Paludisphaera borealis]MDR3622606.1 hypothetical protein [Paludisphaera borealis]
MWKPVLLASIVFTQAAFLILAGLATLWWSEDLMGLLIHLVGEEYALGPQSVIRLEDGSKLLTNPGAMIRWTTPFWALGFLQIASAFTLIGLWRRRRRLSGPVSKED